MKLQKIESTIHEILIVLVLYKTKLENSISFITLTDNIKSINLQLDIFVYDNSPFPMNPIIDRQQTKISKFWNILYHHDPTNPGVSKAYNEGFKKAEKLNKKWLMLIDQDTKFAPDALEKYCLAVVENPDSVLFSPILTLKDGTVLSPCKYFFKRGFPFPSIDVVKLGKQSIKNRLVLNSGMLINMDMFKELGGYNEKIRLDFSDCKFIDKYRKVRKYFVVVDTKCLHGFSDSDNNFEASYSRFALYCEGASNSIENISDAFMLAIITFFRALKLTLKFNNHQFLILLYQIYTLKLSKK